MDETMASDADWDDAPLDETDPASEELLYGDDPWTARRRQATIALVAGAGIFLLSLVIAAGFITGGGFENAVDFLGFGVWITIFSLLLVAFLVWLLVLFFTTPADHTAQEWYDDDWEADEEVEAVPETITLRCPRCTNAFNVVDTGERPLRHICPHCSAKGLFE